jgi:hypothetical protein
MSRGKITVGYGSTDQREMEIIDFVQAKFKDNRFVTVGGIEDGSLVVMVENPASTVRNAQTNLWLTKESFIGLLSTAFLYFSCKGEDMDKLLMEALEKEDIDYVYSDNLMPVNPDSKDK